MTRRRIRNFLRNQFDTGRFYVGRGRFKVLHQNALLRKKRRAPELLK